MKFSCPHCDGHIAADAEWSGREAQCPHCGYAFSVPTIEIMTSNGKPPRTRMLMRIPIFVVILVLAIGLILGVSGIALFHFRELNSQSGISNPHPPGRIEDFAEADSANVPESSANSVNNPTSSHAERIAKVNASREAKKITEPDITSRWLSEARTKISWKPSLGFDPKLEYSTQQGFNNMTRYYSSAYHVNVQMNNNTDYPLQLGETVFVFEISAGDALFAAGCDQRDGVQDKWHVTDIEDRYGLDGHDWRSRNGERPQTPLVGGGTRGFSANDDGIFRRISLFEVSSYYVSLPSCLAYGFGQIARQDKLEVCAAVLFGSNVKRPFMNQVLLVSPTIASEEGADLPKVRLLSHFTARPSDVGNSPDSSQKKSGANEEIAAPVLAPPTTEMVVMDVPSLSAILKDTNRTSVERLLAINWLAELRDPSTLPLLRETLGSTNLPTLHRAVAAWGLSKLDDRESITAFRQYLREDLQRAPLLSAYCAKALAEMGVRQAASDLVPALKLRPLVCGKWFITAAQKMADPELGPSLLAILKDDKEKEHHGIAAAAAAVCASPEVIDGFERLAWAAASCEGSPLYAINRLARIKQPAALDALIRVATSIKPAAIPAIRLLAEWPVTRGEIQLFCEKTTHDEDEEDIHPELPSSASTKAIVTLAGLAQRTDIPKENRETAISALGRTKSIEAMTPLNRIAADTNAAIRALALEAMSNLPVGQPPAVLPSCLTDNDPKVVEAAVTLIQKWNLREHVPALLKLLRQKTQDGGIGIHSKAAEALAEFGSKESIPELLALLNDKNDYAAETATRALAKFHATEAVAPILKRLIRDSAADSMISSFMQTAPASLAEIGGIEAQTALFSYIDSLQNKHPQSSALEYALAPLGKIGGKEVEARLLAAIKTANGDSDVIAAAIEGLAEAKIAHALPSILVIAKSKNADRKTIAAAVRAIEKCEATDEVPWLCSVLTMPHTDVKQVASVLGHFKDKRALSCLRKELSVYSHDSETRQALKHAVEMIQ